MDPLHHRPEVGIGGLQQDYPQCGLWCDSVRHRIFHECMVAMLKVLN